MHAASIGITTATGPLERAARSAGLAPEESPLWHAPTGQHRVWPWLLAVCTGLLTTAGGSGGYELLGSLTTVGAVVMIVVAVRHNRAVRQAALAAAQAHAPRSGKKPTIATGSRKPGTSRRTARTVIIFLPFTQD